MMFTPLCKGNNLWFTARVGQLETVEMENGNSQFLTYM